MSSYHLEIGSLLANVLKMVIIVIGIYKTLPFVTNFIIDFIKVKISNKKLKDELQLEKEKYRKLNIKIVENENVK